MTGVRNAGTRRSMRAIPLTQRQRKHGIPTGMISQRPQGAPKRRKDARPERMRPDLILPAPTASVELSAPTAPLITPDPMPALPSDPIAGSAAAPELSAPEPPADALDMLDTTWLGIIPKAETEPEAMSPAPEHGALTTSDPAAPRRVKVRVRRKRPTPAPRSAGPSEVNAEMEETVILPTLASQDNAPGLTLNITCDGETVTQTLPMEAPPAQDAALDAETTPLDPSTTTGAPDEPPAPCDTAPAGEPEAPEAPEAPQTEPEPEPRLAVTTRKLPTLAVMAALASRAETREEEEKASEKPDSDEPRATEPPQWPDAVDASAEEPDAASDESDEKLLSDLRAMLSGSSTPLPTSTRDTRPGARGARSTTQPLAPDDASGKRGMWWLKALHQPQGERATPDGATLDAGGEPPTGPLWTAPETAPRARPITQPPAPRRAPVVTRQLEREAAIMDERPQFPRPWPSGARMDTKEQGEGLSTLLTWVGAAHAALCGTGAFVAAIALLNGSAGERAVTVFAWAVTFALIAGTGAWLGHLAWRMRRAGLATLSLLLSQFGLLIWALNLLGARPALMTLAFFSVALALRGLGRPAAVISGLAALALFTLTLTLNVSGVWGPAVNFTGASAAILDTALVAGGMALLALALTSLYAAGERERARTRAIERAARLAAHERDALRTQTEDDANMLRQALSDALRGVPTEGMRARGALSPLAEQVNVVAERLVDLSYDREERKRLESATRRLIRNIERAWLGLSWEWPEASGVIIDDLIALLRTPPSEPAQLPEDTTPTAQLVAPHLYRAWQPGASIPSQPLTPPSQPLTPQPSLWPDRSTPSQPSGVWQSLWPSEPGPATPGTDPLALPPSPRWPASDPGGLSGFTGGQP